MESILNIDAAKLPEFEWGGTTVAIIKYIDYISPEIGLVRREKLK